MADPLSIAASVVGVATLFLQSSKVLTDFVQDVKGAPAELKAIASDANAFSAQVLAVKISLADTEIARLVDKTEVIRGLMANMRDAMQSCADACQSLLEELDSHATSTTTGFRLARDLGRVFKKKDILAALGYLVIHMHTAVLASGNADTVQVDPAVITSPGINVASTLGKYAASVAAGPDSRLAVDAVDIDLMGKILDQGVVSVDTVFHEGHTALLQAVVKSDLAMVEFCLDHGADPHAALLQAVFDENLPMVQLLVDRGACPRAIALSTDMVMDRKFEVKQLNQRKDTVLHLAIRGSAKLSDWCDLQSVDDLCTMVLTLLESGADVDATNASGDTPLGLLLRTAAGGEHCEKLVRILIDHGASPNSVNRVGDTPLSSTLCGQYPSREFGERTRMAKLLIEMGADPNVDVRKGTSLLHALIEARLLQPRAVLDFYIDANDLASMLLSAGLDVSRSDAQGRSLLAAIMMVGFSEWFHIFKKHITEKKVVFRPTTALMTANEEHDAGKIVRLLVQTRDNETHNANSREEAFCEAVCWAVALQDKSLVSNLLGRRLCAPAIRKHTCIAGCNVVPQPSVWRPSPKYLKHGPPNSPLIVAARAGDPSMIRLLHLYQYPARMQPGQLQLNAAAIETAIEWRNLAAMQEIIRLGVSEDPGCLVSWMTIADAVERAPVPYIDALLSALPKTGRSMPSEVFEKNLDRCGRDCGEMLYCFAAHGFSPQARRKYGRTLLHDAAEQNFSESLMAMAYSINRPGWIGTRDHQGQTACQVAGHKGWYDHLGAMLTAGGRRSTGSALCVLELEAAKDVELAQALGLTTHGGCGMNKSRSDGTLQAPNERLWLCFTDPYLEPGLLKMSGFWSEACGYYSEYQWDHFISLPQLLTVRTHEQHV
ncbi:hypothetical protein LTR95_007548 [Oleoguttula sp. CCFEE 5521]